MKPFVWSCQAYLQPLGKPLCMTRKKFQIVSGLNQTKTHFDSVVLWQTGHTPTSSSPSSSIWPILWNENCLKRELLKKAKQMWSKDMRKLSFVFLWSKQESSTYISNKNYKILKVGMWAPWETGRVHEHGKVLLVSLYLPSQADKI